MLGIAVATMVLSTAAINVAIMHAEKTRVRDVSARAIGAGRASGWSNRAGSGTWDWPVANTAPHAYGRIRRDDAFPAGLW